MYSRAIPTLEGTDDILDGDYWTRSDPIYKCYKVVKKLGFKVFALQAGGWCASSSTAQNTFNEYGMASKCKNDGEGGPNANEVYYIKGIYYPSTKTLYSVYICKCAVASARKIKSSFIICHVIVIV